MLAVLLACASPDPDARLRVHDLDGASAAWAALHGAPLDTDHPVADILSRRAAVDPGVTSATLEATMRAVRLLEGGKPVGLVPLDLPVDTMHTWLGAIEPLAVGSALVAAGRSETGLDKDPYQGGPLPWRGGRMLGFAERDLAALGTLVDEAAAPRLVTLRLRDETGELTLTFTRKDGAWWTTATSDGAAGARLVLAGTLAAEAGAAAAEARHGKGWVAR